MTCCAREGCSTEPSRTSLLEPGSRLTLLSNAASGDWEGAAAKSSSLRGERGLGRDGVGRREEREGGTGGGEEGAGEREEGLREERVRRERSVSRRMEGSDVRPHARHQGRKRRGGTGVQRGDQRGFGSREACGSNR
eukprot:2678064-Rhodomonas_salina.1